VAIQTPNGPAAWRFGSEIDSAPNYPEAAGDPRARLGLPDAPTEPAYWQESSGSFELGPPVNIPSI
jgi:hypothetical protein